MPLVSLIFRRTLAPSGALNAQNYGLLQGEVTLATALKTEQLIHLNVAQARGVMSREILLYGPLFYGHRLGRYFCPDDLTAAVSKTGAFMLPFYFAVLPAAQLAEASRPSARNIALIPRIAARTVPVLD